MARRRAEQDLGAWIPLVSPGFDRPSHLSKLLSVFDRIQRGERIFLLAEAPPRHGKSETVFHGIVRYLRARPTRRVIYGTYSMDFAIDQSRRVRTIASAAGLWVGAEEKTNSRWEPARAARHWQTSEGGGFVAVGRGGGVTGRGGDLIVIDDPFKDRDEAERAGIRDDVDDWFRGTIFSRREPGASVVVFHQRWNQDDLIARLAETPIGPGINWERVTFPAILPDGQPLWGERYDLDELAIIEEVLGPYNWHSQYMQAPRPRGTEVFLEPARYDDSPRLLGKRVAICCDPAASTSTRADASGIVVAAFDGSGVDMTMDVLEGREVRMTVPDLCRELLATQTRWGGAPLIVEAVGGFKSVPQTIRDIQPAIRVHEIHPTTDKWLRAQPVSAAWNGGRVRVSASAPWASDYVTQLKAFTGTGDKEDNLVDATAHVWNWAVKFGLGGKAGARSGGKRAMVNSPF